MTEAGGALIQMGECLMALGSAHAEWGGADPMPRWGPKCAMVVWDGTVPTVPEEVRSLLLAVARDVKEIAERLPRGESE